MRSYCGNYCRWTVDKDYYRSSYFIITALKHASTLIRLLRSHPSHWVGGGHALDSKLPSKIVVIKLSIKCAV